MPELNWNLTDVIECLEVTPRSDEHSTEHVFDVERDGLSLKMSVGLGVKPDLTIDFER